MAGALECQKIREFGDLPVEPVKDRVATRDLAGQEELAQHEHRNQEDDRKEQRGQGIHEARPVIDRAAPCATSAADGCHLTPPIRSRGRRSCQCDAACACHLTDPFAAEAVEHLLEFLFTGSLRLDPVPDHLLFRPHVLDEALNTLGEIGHRLGRRPVAGPFGQSDRQAVQGRSEVGTARAERGLVFTGPRTRLASAATRGP